MAHHMRVPTRPLGALEARTTQGIVSIVKQLRILAIDDAERTGLARCGMLSGLIGWMEGSKDPDVIYLAVDTVRMLASHIDNVDLMRAAPGLEAALNRIAEVREHPASAAAAVDALRDLGLREDKNPSPSGDWRHSDEASRASEEGDEVDVGSVQIAFKDADFDAIPVTLGHAREIELDVPMIRHKDVRSMVERVLLRTRGVMSVYLDHAQQKARVAFRGERKLLLTVLRREGIVVIDPETPARSARSRARSCKVETSGTAGKEISLVERTPHIAQVRLSRLSKATPCVFHAEQNEDLSVNKKDEELARRLDTPLSDMTNVMNTPRSSMSSSGKKGLSHWDREMVEEIARAIEAGTPCENIFDGIPVSSASVEDDQQTPSYYAETYAIRSLREQGSPAYLDPDEDYEAVDPEDANSHRAAGLPQKNTPKGLAAVLFGAKEDRLERHCKQVKQSSGISLWQRTARMASSLQNLF